MTTSTSGRLGSTTAATALVVGAATVGGLYFLYSQKRKADEDTTKDTVKECDTEILLSDDKIPRDLLFDTMESGDDQDDVLDNNSNTRRILSPGTITIAHASVTGTCRSLAEKLRDQLSSLNSSATIQLCSTDDFDWWDELLNNEEEESSNDLSLPPPIVVLILPTHSQGTWPTTASSLQTALQDVKHDWRIEKKPLASSNLHITCFGMGSSAYDESTMGLPAKEAFREFAILGAKTIASVGVGDDAVGNAAQESFDEWKDNVVSRIQDIVAPSSSSCACGSEAPSDGCCQTNAKEEEYYSDDDDEEQQGEPAVMDLEDIGDSMMAQQEEKKDNEVTEMVTPSQAAALKKEGYKLIGTHSAVKLCRWTKHQLRGRGGCYKHTFYGITSYQCMEATPSLACANKCTFRMC